MFGNSFGAKPAFGQAAGGFGQAAGGFGQPAAGGFGASSGGAFGAKPAAGGFGGFGAAPATGGFGAAASGGFGAAAQTSGFGAAAQTGGFGAAATGFGRPAAGGFGQQAAAGAFGGGGGAFGQPAAAGGFGATKSAFGGFGAAPAAGAGGFGAATSAFGASAGGGGFGAATLGAANSFGQSAVCPGSNKGMFAPASVQKTAANGTPAQGVENFYTISANNQLATFSHEEIRMADYSAGKHKNPAAAGAPAAGAFGAASTGGFGTAATGGFGAQPTSAFGAAPTTGFGAKPGGFGGFGAAAAATTGGFGGFGAKPASQAGFGGFGAAAASTGGFGGFGAAASTGGFGGFGAKPASQAGFGGFGAASSSGFGAKPGGFGGFGTTAAATTGGFGGFGAKPASQAGFGGFGAATGGFGGFGAAASTGGFGGFGAASSSGFGGFGAKPATGGFGGFGAATSGGMFGAKPATGGFGGFGASTGSMFGAKPGGFGGLGGGFGTGTTFGAPSSGFGATGTTFGAQPMAAPGVVGAAGMAGMMASPQMAMLMMQNMHARPVSNPLGPSPFEKVSTAKEAPSTSPANDTSKAVVAFPDRTRRHELVNSYSGTGTRRGANASFPVRPRTSRLASPAQEAINTPGRSPRRRSGFADDRGVTTDASYDVISQSWAADPRLLTDVRTNLGEDDTDPTDTPLVGPEEDDDCYKPVSSPLNANPRQAPAATAAAKPRPDSAAKSPVYSDSYDPGQMNDKWARPKDSDVDGASTANTDFPRLPPGCSCEPSVAELKGMSAMSRKCVKKFTLKKEGFGSICFDGEVDVTSLDLTAEASTTGEPLVYWENKKHNCTGVVLYPDPASKPAQGHGLNRPAEITLCFASGWSEGRLRDSIEDGQEDDEDKMAFVSYATDTGELKFRVQHFTRWGLSSAVCDAATPRPMEEDSGRASSTKKDRMEQSDGSIKMDSFLKIGGHPSVRIAYESPDDTPAATDTSAAIHVDPPLADIDSVHNVMRNLESETDNRRSFFGGDDNRSASFRSPIALSDASTHSPFMHDARAMVVSTAVPPPALANLSERPTHRIRVPKDDPRKVLGIRVPDKDPRKELEMPCTSDEFSVADPWVATAEETGVARAFRVDFGARMGRSFGVAWGPGGMLAYNFLGSSDGGAAGANADSDSSVSCLQIQTVDAALISGAGDANHSSADALARGIDIHLKHHSDPATAADDNEDIEIDCDRQLVLLNQYVAASTSSTEKEVWELIRSLYFGDADADMRLAVSDWLEEATAELSPPADHPLGTSVADRALKLVHLLSCRHIETACAEATNHRDFRLASLIAQADCDLQLREDMKKQVHSWKQRPAGGGRSPWQEMEAPERHVYAILSGQFEVNESVLGVTAPRLGWRRCFGLHLWYKLAGHGQSGDKFDEVKAVVQGYEAAWQANKAARPRPAYVAGRAEDALESEMLDMSYILLAAAATAKQNTTALHPLSITPFPLDCAFAWHLQSFLAGLHRIGEGSAKTVMAPLPAQLHSGFIFQLESRGLLKEAVYIAAQWQSPTTPDNGGVQGVTPLPLELLCRYTPSLSQTDFTWLHRAARLPLCWLAYARALAARHRGDVAAEAILLAETLAAAVTRGAATREDRPVLLDFAQRVRVGLAPDVDPLFAIHVGNLSTVSDQAALELGLAEELQLAAAASSDVEVEGGAAHFPSFGSVLSRCARAQLREVALGRLAPFLVAQTRRRRRVAGGGGASEQLMRSMAQLLQMLSAAQNRDALGHVANGAPAAGGAMGTEARLAAALEAPFLAYQRLRDLLAAEQARAEALRSGQSRQRGPAPGDDDNMATEEEDSKPPQSWLVARDGLRSLLGALREAASAGVEAQHGGTIEGYELALASELAEAVGNGALEGSGLALRLTGGPDAELKKQQLISARQLLLALAESGRLVDYGPLNSIQLQLKMAKRLNQDSNIG